MKTTEQTISSGKHFLGKTDYETKGRKNCEAYITWKLRNTADGPEFSAQAEIWQSNKRDIMCGGQCVDTVAALFPSDKRAQEIKAVWEKYHLNGMKAGCEHQRANWNTLEPITLYYFRRRREVVDACHEAKHQAKACIKAGQTFAPTPEQTRLANLPDKLTLETAELPAELAKDYRPDGPAYEGDNYGKASETKTAGWVKPSEHSKGLLCKPCEVCGYEYGSAWLYSPIPADVIAQIKSWNTAPNGKAQ
jgi:hypothetical protein